MNPARDLLRDVLRAYELGGRGKGGRAGQLGVDLPAAGQPAELLVRPRDGGVPVPVEADRQLADLRLDHPRGREIEAEVRRRLGERKPAFVFAELRRQADVDSEAWVRLYTEARPNDPPA